MTETLSREPSEMGGFEGVANGAEVNQVGGTAVRQGLPRATP